MQRLWRIATIPVGRINATETQSRFCHQSSMTDYLERFERKLDAFTADVETDLHNFKADVTTELHGVKTELRDFQADVKTEFQVVKTKLQGGETDLHNFKADVATKFHGVKTDLNNVKPDLRQVKTIVTGLNKALLPLPLEKIGNYRDSVVGVETSDGGAGTGFVVGNGQRYVLTARHVVVQALPNGEILLAGHVRLPKRSAEVKYTAAWLHVDSKVDIALLEFTEELNQSQLPLTPRAPPLGTKVFNLTTDSGPLLTKTKIQNLLFSTLEMSGTTRTVEGLDALLVTGPGRTGHSGSPVGRDGGIFGIVVESAGPRRKRSTLGEALDDAFENATSQRGVVLRLFPYLRQEKWFKVDLDTATSHVAIEPSTAPLRKLIDVLGFKPKTTK
jgi:S1-C subfamily serine protease